MKVRTRLTHCAVEAAMQVVTGKWKVHILWALSPRPRRFGELRRLLPGVSDKVLIDQLRELMTDEIVHRDSHPGPVPHVEYSLTARGAALNEALRPLGAWGREHL